MLLIAASRGKLDLLKEVGRELDHGRGLKRTIADIKNPFGGGVIHIAASYGKIDVCKYLIEEVKVNVDDKDDDGQTPFYYASMEGHMLTAMYLLEHGADPATSNDIGFTPLHHAAEKGNAELVHVLLSKGINVDAQSDNATPLLMAASTGKHDIVKILLDHHADPNLSVSHLGTPLVTAVTFKSLQCTKLLIQAGADLNAKTQQGEMPLGVAALKGVTEIIKCLLEAGADPNMEDIIVLNRCKRFSEAKSKGEDAFRTKDYFLAIAWYSEANALQPWEATILSNLSLCYARLKIASEALSNAKACIRFRPNWMKGYYRAGVAYNLLKEFDLAVDAFAESLKLEPENSELQSAFQLSVMSEISIEDRILEAAYFGDLTTLIGETPLSFAIKQDQLGAVTYLPENGANPSIPNADADGSTPLQISVAAGLNHTVQLLLSKGAYLHAQNRSGSAILLAACSRDAELVQILLDHNADPNFFAAHLCTSLAASITTGSVECAKLLIQAGADPNGISLESTPLRYATHRGESEIIKYLLEAGDDPNRVDWNGEKPIEISAFQGHLQDVKTLFPVTSPIPACSEWSVDGIVRYVRSRKAFQKRKRKAKEVLLETKLKAEDSFRSKEYDMGAGLMDDQDATLLSKRSECWALMGKAGPALADAKSCITLRPDWSEAYYRKGVALNLGKEYAEAADAFLKSLKLNPDNIELRNVFRETVEARVNSIHLQREQDDDANKRRFFSLSRV
ncbi:hypothetical protein GIB67_027146 [Kingdonia uniflora]|uniref:Uncharacterized protein n=1 Tax=Kingdonia uniflora TaxID=39325 RepID=A0A7J7P1Z5_9MAGN|nr:hypothetical protein GIB67_027146 [Kingdonia uniflora]